MPWLDDLAAASTKPVRHMNASGGNSGGSNVITSASQVDAFRANLKGKTPAAAKENMTACRFEWMKSKADKRRGVSIGLADAVDPVGVVPLRSMLPVAVSQKPLGLDKNAQNKMELDRAMPQALDRSNLKPEQDSSQAAPVAKVQKRGRGRARRGSMPSIPSIPCGPLTSGHGEGPVPRGQNSKDSVTATRVNQLAHLSSLSTAPVTSNRTASVIAGANFDLFMSSLEYSRFEKANPLPGVKRGSSRRPVR